MRIDVTQRIVRNELTQAWRVPTVSHVDESGGLGAERGDKTERHPGRSRADGGGVSLFDAMGRFVGVQYLYATVGIVFGDLVDVLGGRAPRSDDRVAVVGERDVLPGRASDVGPRDHLVDSRSPHRFPRGVIVVVVRRDHLHAVVRELGLQRARAVEDRGELSLSVVGVPR